MSTTFFHRPLEINDVRNNKLNYRKNVFFDISNRKKKKKRTHVSQSNGEKFTTKRGINIPF